MVSLVLEVVVHEKGVVLWVRVGEVHFTSLHFRKGSLHFTSGKVHFTSGKVQVKVKVKVKVKVQAR
jgi:hypothetical protein